MAIDDIGRSEPAGLSINEQAYRFLKETAKWCSFLSILGFIGIGILVIIALFFGAMMASLSSMGASNDFNAALGGGFFTVLYLIMAVLYFFPVYYLYKFSVNMKTALYKKDEETLTKAFEYMKSHYKFVGIFTIVMLSLYLLLLIVGLIGGLASL